jgi:hypothetical protein
VNERMSDKYTPLLVYCDMLTLTEAQPTALDGVALA